MTYLRVLTVWLGVFAVLVGGTAQATNKPSVTFKLGRVVVGSYDAMRSYDRDMRSAADLAVDQKRFINVVLQFQCSDWNKEKHQISVSKDQIYLVGKSKDKINPFFNSEFGSYGTKRIRYDVVRPKDWESGGATIAYASMVFLVPSKEKTFVLNFAGKKKKLTIPRSKKLFNALNKPEVTAKVVEPPETIGFKDYVARASTFVEYRPPAGAIFAVETTMTSHRSKLYPSGKVNLYSEYLGISFGEGENVGFSQCSGAIDESGNVKRYLSTTLFPDKARKNTLLFYVPESAKKFKLYMYGVEISSFSRQ